MRTRILLNDPFQIRRHFESTSSKVAMKDTGLGLRDSFKLHSQQAQQDHRLSKEEWHCSCRRRTNILMHAKLQKLGRRREGATLSSGHSFTVVRHWRRDSTRTPLQSRQTHVSTCCRKLDIWVTLLESEVVPNNKENMTKDTNAVRIELVQQRLRA